MGRCRLMSRDANSAHEMNSLSFIRRPRQEPWRSFAIWVTDFQVRVSPLLFSLNHPLQGVQPHSSKQSLYTELSLENPVLVLFASSDLFVYGSCGYGGSASVRSPGIAYRCGWMRAKTFLSDHLDWTIAVDAWQSRRVSST